VDDVMQLTEGFAHYLPLSHGKYAIDQLDFSSLGLLHTGQLGDVTLGSYCRQHKHSRATHQKYISDKLLHHLPDEDCLDYENQEMMLYLNRGLNYILMGNLPVQQHSEALSPFLDVDVLEFCLSLPLEYRAHHAIYKKWILQKYPDAARYKWESLGRRINARTVLINGKSIALTALPAFILQGIQYHLKGSKKVSARNRGMNPFPYWYAHRPGIRENLDRYFLNHVDLIRDPALKSDCEALYHDGSVYEKSQVLSLLSTFKLFLHP